MENTAHLRQVYAIHPQLAADHVLFDFLTEDTLDQLPRYRVLILPAVKDLSAAQQQAIAAWRRRGGRLLTGLEPLPDRYRWTARPVSAALRANAYWKRDAAEATVVLHVLNYEISAKGEVTPARDVPVSLPLPAAIHEWQPGAVGAPADAAVREGRLCFTVPEVRVHSMIQISLHSANMRRTK